MEQSMLTMYNYLFFLLWSLLKTSLQFLTVLQIVSKKTQKEPQNTAIFNAIYIHNFGCECHGHFLKKLHGVYF